ncbi:MAG TPA: TadE/TadG family type IV pilus assembly protein [Polyangia bacterium]|nr:TadE/TadG family type IV pilus assembly protein [Polyangia bacterium]
MVRCERSRRQRGAAAIEFALAVPVLLLVVAGGVVLGRVLVTRHRLADAVSYATRSAALARQTDAGTIQQTILNRLGPEQARCAPLQVRTLVVPGAYPGGQALEVTVLCQVAPIFQGRDWSSLGPSQLTVVAAMPL